MTDTLSLYDPVKTLGNVDAYTGHVLTFGGIALICNMIFFTYIARQGFKHKTFIVPYISTLIFIPHDFQYLLMYEKWFVQYDHWFPKLFWVGLIITNLFEAVFLYQTLRWGRKDVMPYASQKTYVLCAFLALAGVSVFWVALKAMLADDLWFYSFGATIWLCIPFAIPSILKRGSSAGHSMGMWLACLLMGTCWWIAVWPLDPYFRSYTWIMMGLSALIWGLATLYIVRRYKPAEP